MGAPPNASAEVVEFSHERPRMKKQEALLSASSSHLWMTTDLSILQLKYNGDVFIEESKVVLPNQTSHLPIYFECGRGFSLSPPANEATKIYVKKRVELQRRMKEKPLQE
ncbi:hypothetical protein Nepgr_030396 [Nepenthes gracilis]|uniref:Uncharacterized protein n=1 Tax=Nepenthes gracilis TaxID=150966 RepID=A0AAD3TGE8_NEPGR|nr:hypothetical protein Nepgr_030396 [Nepenthes gracilis]